MTHRAPYTPEFRTEAVRLLRHSSKPMAKIARHRLRREVIVDHGHLIDRAISYPAR